MARLACTRSCFFFSSVFNTLTSRWTRAAQKLPRQRYCQGLFSPRTMRELPTDAMRFNEIKGFGAKIHVSFSTYNLKFSHVTFPPQVLLILWSHGCQHVIEVHQDVNEVVENVGECRVSTWKQNWVRWEMNRSWERNSSSPEMNLTKSHASIGVSAWWYRWSQVICVFFLRRMKNTVSANSVNFDR